MTVREAARAGEVVLATIPEGKVPELPKDLFLGAPVYTTDRDADGVRRALAQASPERTPEWRTTEESPGTGARRA